MKSVSLIASWRVLMVALGLITTTVFALALGSCVQQHPRVGDILEPVAILKGSENDAVLKLAVSPDGRYVAAQTYDTKTIYVLDVEQKRLLHRLPLYHGGGVNFTPDGKHLYTSDWVPDRDVSLVTNEKDAQGRFLPYGGKWQYRKRKPEEQFKGHLWDLQTGQKLKTYYRDNDAELCSPYDMHFDQSGKQYTASARTGIYFCDAETTKPIRFIPYPWMNEKGEPRGQDSGKPHLGLVKAFAMLPDWKTTLLVVVRHYPPNKEEQQWKDWSSEELVLAWFNLQTGKIVREALIAPRLPVNYAAWSMTLSPDGQLVTINSWAILSSERMNEDVEAYSKRQAQRVFDTRSGRLVHELVIGHTRKSSAFSPDNTRLIIASDRVTLWKIETGEKLGEFDDSRRYARKGSSNYMQMALSADGCTLAAGGEDTVIYVWSVKDCRRQTAALN